MSQLWAGQLWAGQLFAGQHRVHPARGGPTGWATTGWARIDPAPGGPWPTPAARLRPRGHGRAPVRFRAATVRGPRRLGREPSAAAGGAGTRTGPGSGRAGEAPALPMRTPGSANRPRRLPGRGPQAERAATLGTGREARQRTAVDGRARLRSEPNGSATPRLPSGLRGAVGSAADGLGRSGLGGSGLSGAGAGGTGAGEIPAKPEPARRKLVPSRPDRQRPADPGPPPMTASGLVRRRPKSQSPFPDLQGPPPGL